MKLKNYALLTVVTALFLFGLVGWSVYAQKKDSGKVRVVWEYREAVNLPVQLLNEFGADGWEMVGYSVDANGSKFVCFKRAK